MSKPQMTKFTFDTAFDHSEAKRNLRRLSPTEIEAIETAAFQAGRESERASQAVILAQAVERMVDTVHRLDAALHVQLRAARAEATALAYATARKLAETLLSRHPADEIEGLIAKCCEEQKGEPAIVIRVNDQIHDAVRDAAAKIKASRGFEGRVVIIGEPQIGAGDCAIEWADGGLERNLGHALNEIETVLKGYISTEGGKNPDLFNALVAEMDQRATQQHTT